MAILSINRHWQIEFFDVRDGTITPVRNLVLRDPTNVAFNYTVAPFGFNSATFHFFNIQPNVVEYFSLGAGRGFVFKTWYGGADDQNVDEKTYHEIFKGLVFRTNTYRNGPDLITEVIGYDTLFALTKPKASLTFENGATSLQVLQKVLTYYNGPTSLVGGNLLTKVYSAGFALVNQSLDSILKTIAADNGCLFSITGGTLIFYPQDEKDVTYSPINAPIIVSPKTGLVGNVRAEGLSVQLVPIDYFNQKDLTKNRPLITATILLRKVNIFSPVRLKDTEFKQFNEQKYYILGVSYNGEYRGNNWYTVLKLCPTNR